ncbi:TnsA endonuclease N-terminal domain-containing protein [Bradyrhizobium manausense]|uniref:TnsA endonuclease N-terminal domain-containing protein n=1 Tax=Bradyrhizobium manausense TaxID=989370 RepID=UPI001BAAAFCF|nr:TnsA endonuclease N-terminal domain-containing protein [Bradyrhizobium manausense]MBR0793055.1 TnsA endonuclease N-terminal domain-containing protein [Bradyrhizobium manausense]
MSQNRPQLESVRIVRAQGGGPIRTIVEAAKSMPCGDFPSLKAGRAIPWEGIERRFVWTFEARWDVKTYMSQPFRFEFRMSDGSTLFYFPDFELVLDGDEIEIVEIKKTEAETRRDPHYAFKLWLARRVCEKRGWKFRVLTADEYLADGHLLENAQHIRMNRTAAITAEDYIRLGEASRRRCGGTMTWADAVAALSRTDDPWSRDGLARLHALIVRRYVRVDITRRITQRTPVEMTEASAIELGR